MVPVSKPSDASREELESVRESRDALETLAESDLRSAKWARALLDAADAEDST